MSKPTPQQTWIGVIMMVLTIVSSYLGYDKYEQVRAAEAEPATVTVNVESMPDTHDDLTKLEIEALIANAVKAERARNAGIYKRLESWER
jgi:cytochrome c-type biogenesis protein CcmH/NrfG